MIEKMTHRLPSLCPSIIAWTVLSKSEQAEHDEIE